MIFYGAFTLCVLLPALVASQSQPHIVKIKRSNSGMHHVSDFVSRRMNRLTQLERKLLSTEPEQSHLTYGVRNFIWSYLIEVDIGTAEDGTHQKFDMVLDSGSSILWVPGKACTTNTCHMEADTALFDPGLSTTFQEDKNNHINVSYGSGACNGIAGQDSIFLNGLEVKDQMFGIADTVTSDMLSGGVEGIFGIGPSQSTAMFNKLKQVWDTPLDSLAKSNTISKNMFSVYFDGVDNVDDIESNNGQFTIGDLPSRDTYTGEISWLPRFNEDIFGFYWGVQARGMKIGDNEMLRPSKGIVDTGTTMIIVSDAFSRHSIRSIRGVTLDINKRLLVVRCTNIKDLPTISFLFDEAELRLTPEQYVAPAWQAPYWKVQPGFCPLYISVENIAAFDFVLGQKFLEQYVSVYDADNNRVGFAPSVHYASKVHKGTTEHGDGKSNGQGDESKNDDKGKAHSGNEEASKVHNVTPLHAH
ncbi:acid protease [Hesseltinella vesiculosa]|uniref:Acid protease n=1 Tax=Hesseltinella vesiculosa TaxID=101127 RepID=A0A1X2G3Y5_9FUNG|nr:acid protease [Hesseltinella vesiculosa]